MSYHLKFLPSKKRLLLSNHSWSQYKRFYADLEPKTVRKLFSPNPNKVRYKPLKVPPKVPSLEAEIVARKNQLGIQMLSKSIYQQIFVEGYKETANEQVLEFCKKELEKHNMISNDIELQKDVDFKIPPLKGKNVEEHFRIIGEEQAKPYKDLVEELLKGMPEAPKEWVFEAGWIRYEPGQDPARVDFPLEEALVFDVEVCMMVGKTPTLATAVSSKAWYGWVSPTLITGVFKPSTNHQYHPEQLIPLESTEGDTGLTLTEKQKRPKVVIGHNVSFDRAKIREQYWLNKTGTRFIDTMSLHVCVSGLTSYQRAVMKSEKFMEEDESWKNCSSLNNLVDVFNLYCGKKHSKQTRDIFIEGTLSDIKAEFQEVMKYCCSDVKATYEIMEKLYPLFLERFPHPVTLAGMLELGTAYLPINQNWNRYISDCEQSYEDLESEGRILLARRADQACQLMHDEAFKEDLWLWDQDWDVKNIKTKATVKRKKQTVTSEEEIVRKDIEKQDEIGMKNNETSDKNLGNNNDLGDNEEIDPLEEKFRGLMQTKENLSSVKVLLPGYPNWYRKLCTKPDSTLDWTPGPHLLGTAMKITPKLLCLTWEGYPLHHIKEKGWGFLVPFSDDVDVDRKLPLKRLLEKCPLPLLKEHQGHGADAMADITKAVDTELTRKQFYSRVKKDKTGGLYKGTGIWCSTTVEDCCWFFKLPHKDGHSYNVGNPLAKDFINKFSENVLAGDAESAEKVLTIARMLSYWRNNRARILEQMVVWLPEQNLPKNLQEKGFVYGAIIPQVVVCGTLTRRAMEPTWMTASNAHPERIGSELRAMVQAPPGYKIVGADVDSQELWIASVLGDSYKAGLHGATPLGWMTLSGQKAAGTDMHSVTAKAIGISRDHAKVINYARIYGAGQSFAERLLKQFNPSISESEARSKAQKMFALTKGKKIFFIKPEHALDFDPDKAYNSWQAFEIAKTCGKTVNQMFYKSKWIGGTESAMFNRLEEIANSKEPRTPFLNGRLTRALEPKNMTDDRYLPTRVNWVVQSGAVDFLHLMLVCMQWIMAEKVRFCISFHDEIRYLVPEEHQYQSALALHVTNLLTRAFFAYKLGLRDLPQSVAFFSSVEVDTVLRKDCDNDCKTSSNPHGLEKGYGVKKGESLNIYQAVEKANGKYTCWFDDSRSKKFIEENETDYFVVKRNVSVKNRATETYKEPGLKTVKYSRSCAVQ